MRGPFRAKHTNNSKYMFIEDLSKVLKIFRKISLIIKECPEEILITLAIVLKISKSS
jgi:hypothetical protein